MTEPRRSLVRSLRWLLPLLVLGVMFGVRVSGWSWVEGIQHRAFDAFLTLKPRPYVDAGVRVIEFLMFYRCFSRLEKRRQNIPPFRVCTFLCRFNQT